MTKQNSVCDLIFDNSPRRNFVWGGIDDFELRLDIATVTLSKYPINMGWLYACN